MSKPLFEDYVSISTRRNRKSFILNFLLLWLGFMIGFFVIVASVDVMKPMALFWAAVAVIICMLLFMAAQAMLAVQRGNDMGLRRDFVAAVMLAPVLTLSFNLDPHDEPSLVYGVTALIPHETIVLVINVLINVAALLMLFYLFFKRGQKGPNKWGDDPLAGAHSGGEDEQA